MLIGTAADYIVKIARDGRMPAAVHLGRASAHLLSRIAGTTAAPPLLIGFVAVAVAILLTRSLLDVARQGRRATATSGPRSAPSTPPPTTAPARGGPRVR